jgi:hypothetical protein
VWEGTETIEIDAPPELGETEDHQVEVQWWFRLSPNGSRTVVEHSFRVLPPRAGAEQFAEFIERTGRAAQSSRV